MSKRVGLYGGTFNPIHFGHLNLAFELMEKGGLDEVWWIPAKHSPLRTNEKLLDPKLRLQMVELAIEEIPQFKVTDLELVRETPSYTIDTVKEILKKYPGMDFFLLLGEDLLKNFPEWKGFSELIELIPLLIGGRDGVELPHFPHKVRDAINKGRIKTSLFELSATRVRQRLEKKLYTGHLVPAKVLDFISVNQLYFTA
jgi:nicotinate-nucleotide adenylyltransferase